MCKKKKMLPLFQQQRCLDGFWFFLFCLPLPTVTFLCRGMRKNTRIVKKKKKKKDAWYNRFFGFLQKFILSKSQGQEPGIVADNLLDLAANF